MSEKIDSYIYPVAYGSELETSTLVQRRVITYDELFPDDERFASVVNQYESPQLVRAFIPPELIVGDALPFLKNGFKVYNGSAQDDVRVEVATPECSNAMNLVAVTRAAELLLEAGARNFLETTVDPDITGVRIQKRVADKYGNAWGCHDNFGYHRVAHRILMPKLPQFAGRFLASRYFMTGSGMMTDNGFVYSQKASNTGSDSGYGFFGRHYRNASGEDEYIKRIEIGSSDANISDWAAAVRFGSVAIFFAILAAGYEGKIRKYFNDDTYEASVLAYGKDRNSVRYSTDTKSIRLNAQQVRSVDMQRAVAELFLNNISEMTGAPRDLQRIAAEIVRFCDDFILVAQALKTVADLANRADWAARLMYIDSRLEKAERPDKEQELMVAHAADVNFDVTLLLRTEDGKVLTHYGHGYKLRSRSASSWKASNKAASHFYTQPPEDTRAAARSRLIQSGHTISGIDWHYVRLQIEGETFTIALPDATDPQLPDLAKELMEYTNT